MKTKHVYRAFDLNNQVEELYKKGITRGVYLGFDTLHEYYSVKKGVTTYLYGSPFSGKSEFWLEVLLNLSEFYGYRHVIYTPETGKASEIVAELVSKYSRKPFFKEKGDALDEQELYKALAFIQEYFYIVDPGEEGLTLEDFYQKVEAIEKENDVRIDTTLIDPYNELTNDIGSEGGRQDLLIERQLGIVRKNAQAFNRHNVLVTHCRDQQAIKKTVDGREIWYYPPATAREVAGGQAWYRKAMNLINVWRPPVGYKENDQDEPAEENEVHVIVQKFKPKGTGKRGVVKLYFDTLKNRYYEKTTYGSIRYAGKEPEPARNPYATSFEF